MSCSSEVRATFNENSNGAIGVTITGLNDEELIPNTFLWTWTDNNGNVINNREDEEGTPAAETWVLLQGDDLAITPGLSTLRKLKVSGTLNTILGGIPRLNLPYTFEDSYDICDQKNTT